MQRTIFAVLATAAMAVLGVGCGGKSPGPKRIRLSLILGDTSEWHRGAVRWKELVETSTGGRYRIEVVTNASRSNNSQGMELQDVQAGRLEASLESTILLSTIDDRWAVFSFPWLFSGHDVANAVCDGPAGREMLDHLEERHVVADLGATGNTDVPTQQAVLAHHNIVGDVTTVVNLGAAADAGSRDGGPVYGTVGTDLNIVFYNYCTNLRDLAMTVLVGVVAKAVATNSCSSVDNDPGTDNDAVPNVDLGKQLRPVTDGHLMADVGQRMDDDVIANHDVVTDKGPRANGCALAEGHVLAEVGQRVDAFGQTALGREELKDLAEG